MITNCFNSTYEEYKLVHFYTSEDIIQLSGYSKQTVQGETGKTMILGGGGGRGSVLYMMIHPEFARTTSVTCVNSVIVSLPV